MAHETYARQLQGIASEIRGAGRSEQAQFLDRFAKALAQGSIVVVEEIQTGSRKQSRSPMSTLAAEVLNQTGPGDPPVDPEWLRTSARSLAASVLAQDEKKGQD